MEMKPNNNINKNINNKETNYSIQLELMDSQQNDLEDI